MNPLPRSNTKSFFFTRGVHITSIAIPSSPKSSSKVSGKLGRQRMRKLRERGKTGNSSKRAPSSYVKPHATNGKHGLGMKYSC